MAILQASIIARPARILREYLDKGGILAMRSNLAGNDAKIVFDDRETQETPKIISGATWATVVLLFLIVVLGALFISGFFSTLTGGRTNNPVQTDTRAQP
jgi:hypothetical protein